MDISSAHLDEALRHVSTVLGVSVEDFRKAEDAAFAELGNSPLREAVISRACELMDFQPSARDLDSAVDLWASFTRTWLTPRPGVISALRALKAQGLRTGLISNCDATVPLVWPATIFAPLIDIPVFSSSEGLKKPDAAIYQLAAHRLRHAPQECLFIGDGSSDELTGAVGVGMGAVQLLLDGEDPAVGTWLQRQAWDGPVIHRFTNVMEMVARKPMPS